MGVREVDRGWKRIEREVKALSRRSIKVGIRAGKVSDGVDVVDIAAFNEFGTFEIPARPFMRRTADRAHPDLDRFTRGQLQAVYAGGSAAQLLNRTGLFYQNRMQETVRTAYTWAVPNSAVTIDAKGSDKPLIDDGVMLASIDFQVL